MLSTYCEVEEDDDVSTNTILFEFEIDFRTSAKTTKKEINKNTYMSFLFPFVYILFLLYYSFNLLSIFSLVLLLWPFVHIPMDRCIQNGSISCL